MSHVGLLSTMFMHKSDNAHGLANSTTFSTRASTAADRPAPRRGSAHAKYSVSHHMVI